VSRADNGGKFYINEFKESCKMHKIARKNTTPCTPQHIRVAKRMNRTFMEKERNMHDSARLSYELWVEAVDIVCYFVN
jgi:hypothetical protein